MSFFCWVAGEVDEASERWLVGGGCLLQLKEGGVFIRGGCAGECTGARRVSAGRRGIHVCWGAHQVSCSCLAELWIELIQVTFKSQV